ncbi:MAG TPA: serine hydrolase domain-containing protein [Vicinamibacteria bacterium]|nr:serine hydrolase domain-containing protein [Vicinamibacteria bacterium]
MTISGLRRWTALTAVVSALLAAGSSPREVEAQATGDLEARLVRLDASLEILRRGYAIPGLSAAVVQNQRVVWEMGYGLDDVERGRPATPDTPYRIASLTKTFTSVLLLQCVEEATLDLDDPIQKYGSDIPEAEATVRDILTHTSEQTPGLVFRYSGDRYAVLTPVVEACTGQPYRVALARRILDPLAMRDSVPGQDLENPSPTLRALFEPGTLERYRAVLTRLAIPYSRANPFQVERSEYPPEGINASAGLVSTVRDLASYDSGLDHHLLLAEETQEAAWTPAVSRGGGTLPYGLGWFVQQYRGERVVWHFGDWPGSFSSLIVKVPGRNLTLILLANSDGLSEPFPLASGDVTASIFAALFLRLFLQ